VTKEQAIAALCDELPPGSTVYTIRRSTARSGLSCTMALYTISANRPHSITHLVALALDMPVDAQGALRVRGWGADAGAMVVMNLSYTLHGVFGKGQGMQPGGECDVTDAENYRAGYSLHWVEL
jgi:hypothetical protein